MPPTFNVVLKFLWYLFSRLLVLAAAVGLIVLAFFMAMDYMNASILTKDGLHVRASVIIRGSDPTTLSKVFSKSFLENDELLDSDIYQQYKVSDFDYDAEISFALVFPWQNSVTLQVTEKVTNITAQATPATESGLSETPQPWENAVYNVTLVRYEGSWRVVSMELIEILPSPSPSPSPSPTPTPLEPETSNSV